MSAARIFDALALAVLCVTGATAALTFRDYGLGWDDLTHSQYGELLLQFYASGFSDQRALSFVNLYMYGGGFDMAAALVAKILPFELFETRRLVGAAVGIIGLIATWRIARRIGGPAAGFFATALLAACPHYYAHMFFNPKDAPFAVAMAVLLLALVRALEEFPRPRGATVALFGTGLGLSIGSRILAGFAGLEMLGALILLFGASVRADGWREAARDMGRFLLRLLPGFALAIAIMALVWPWSVTDPLNIFRAVEYFSHFFEKPWREMYEGVATSVPDMPRTYVPVLFLLKMPELFIVLAVAGLAGAADALFRVSARRGAVLLLIALAAILPIVTAVVTRPAMYNGIRHFVFLAPPLAVMGGLAASWALNAAAQYSRALAAGFLTLFAIGIADPVIAMIRLHPYEYTHFNRVAGGIESADDRFMLDYWGLAFKEASEELRKTLDARAEKPKNGRWRIAVCGPHPPAQIALGPQFEATWDPKGADFALMLGEFYCAELDAPVLVEVERENVVFARAYDIRGRNILSLFTLPPVR